ncbi:MAG: hypothetical protein ACI9AR_000037 [Flavobacteriaceae bacterium]|jgi:hypothetical protein
MKNKNPYLHLPRIIYMNIYGTTDRNKIEALCSEYNIENSSVQDKIEFIFNYHPDISTAKESLGKLTTEISTNMFMLGSIESTKENKEFTKNFVHLLEQREAFFRYKVPLNLKGFSNTLYNFGVYFCKHQKNFKRS